MMSGGPPALPVVSGSPPALPPVDPRDPRIRYTFADVAMKLAHDGPWYFVVAVILVVSLRGSTSTLETLNGLALAMLARARSPDAPDLKAHLVRGIAAGVGVLFLFALVHVVAGAVVR
jgi:hypothetical protein